jgi:glycosyltransferase involved in cell wall biosynthesis
LAPAEKPFDFPPTVRYVRLPVLDKGIHPAQLSRLEYAQFCRRFEAAATDYLQTQSNSSPSSRVVVLSNDISEGIDFRRVSRMGIPIVTIFHVDVADFFSRMYLRLKGPPVFPVRLHNALSALRVSGFLPDVLRLVFEKQRDCVLYSSRLVVPSEEMANTLKLSYGEAAFQKTAVFPWGGWEEEFSELEVEREVVRARREFGIQPEAVTLLTLSRISPEKGIDRLLNALLLWENQRHGLPACSLVAVKPEDVHVLICGDAAFMDGQVFAQKLKRLASKLRKIRVSFPGQVGGARKRALFRLAVFYVFPSRHESYGLTLVEALRQGVPVLSSEGFGTRHLVQPSYGRVVDLNGREAPADLLKALQDLVGNPARLLSMRQEAFRAGQEMDFSKTASALRDLITARFS